MKDYVHHPQHYVAGRIEVIDYIKDKLEILPLTPWQGMLWGNVTKYMGRLGLKGNAKQDAQKAMVYLQWLIEDLANETET